MIIEGPEFNYLTHEVLSLHTVLKNFYFSQFVLKVQ